MARLTTDLWVAAYRARLNAEGIFCHIVCKGDATAGAVAVKLATMDGKASLFTRAYDDEFNRVWTTHVDNAPEAEVEEAVSKQRGYDPDLWVIEVEDPRGRALLDQEGLD
jgi:hypothetical protein